MRVRWFWENGRKTKAAGASTTDRHLPVSATPTTSSQGRSKSPFNRRRLPTGFYPGQYTSANRSLTMATRSDCSVSLSSKDDRPY